MFRHSCDLIMCRKKNNQNKKYPSWHIKWTTPDVLIAFTLLSSPHTECFCNFNSIHNEEHKANSFFSAGTFHASIQTTRQAEKIRDIIREDDVCEDGMIVSGKIFCCLAFIHVLEVGWVEHVVGKIWKRTMRCRKFEVILFRDYRKGAP